MFKNLEEETTIIPAEISLRKINKSNNLEKDDL